MITVEPFVGETDRQGASAQCVGGTAQKTRKGDFEMRDQMFAAVWNDGHDRFSSDLDAMFRRAGSGIARRLDAMPDPVRHAVLMVAAVMASAASLALAVPAAAA